MQISLTQHRFGVNYTPARSWWYCWKGGSVLQARQSRASCQIVDKKIRN